MNNLLSGGSFVIDSGIPGPTLVVLGGVHGDERCGIEAVEAIVSDPPQLFRGRLILALGNPEAIRANTRFVTHDLNRAFLPESESSCGCPEHARARELKTILASADVLLDIHASFTRETVPFVICEPAASRVTEFLPFSRLCYGFDAHQPGGTDYYMNSIGKIGICIECGYLNEEGAAKIALQAVDRTLAALGMISALPHPSVRQETFAVLLQYFVQRNFRLEKPLRDFSPFRAGERIGWDGEEEVCAPVDGCILFARDRPMPGDEAFVYLRSLSRDDALPLDDLDCR